MPKQKRAMAAQPLLLARSKNRGITVGDTWQLRQPASNGHSKIKVQT